MIRRSTPRNNYTSLHNGTINDERLSWGSLGILAYLLSKPPGWEVMPVALVDLRDGWGRDRIYALLKELREAGYIVMRKLQTGKADYEVFDEPQSGFPETENPDQGNSPETENPHKRNFPVTENPEQVHSSLEKKDVKKAEKKKKATASFDPTAVILPRCIPRDAWLSWCQHRVELRHHLTKSTTEKQLEKLVEWAASGMRPKDILGRSIENGWQGLFPLDGGGQRNGFHGHSAPRDDDRGPSIAECDLPPE